MKRIIPWLCTVCLAVIAAACAYAQQPSPVQAPQTGQVYWIDVYTALSDKITPENAGLELPDKTLHWVPFLYAGPVEAYRLKNAEDSGLSEPAQVHDLLVARNLVAQKMSWRELDNLGAVFGLEVAGMVLRCPSGLSVEGNSGVISEWDALFNAGIEVPQEAGGVWVQDTAPESGSKRIVRGERGEPGKYDTKSYILKAGYWPVIEPAEEAELIVSQLNLGEFSLEGSNQVQTVYSSGNFIAPSFEGLAGVEMDEEASWQAPDGTRYEPGAPVPDGTTLTAVSGQLQPGFTISATPQNVTYGETATLFAANARQAGTVEFWANGHLVGESAVEEGTAVWNVCCAGENWPVGTHELTACAMDANGETAAQAHTTLSVQAAKPVVRIVQNEAVIGSHDKLAVEIMGVQNERLSSESITLSWYLDEKGNTPAAQIDRAGIYYAQANFPAQGNYTQATSPLTPVVLTEPQTGDMDDQPPDQEGDGDGQPPDELYLNMKMHTMHPQQTVRLAARFDTGEEQSGTVFWRSNDTSVATVDARGLVTAKSEGVAAITAYGQGCVAACVIVVEPSTPEPQEILLDHTAASLKPGERFTLQAQVKPEQAAQTVTWFSSNPLVATVENGVVNALEEGASIITAQAGACSAVCLVTVEQEPVEDEDGPQKIVLDRSNMVLQAGQSETLYARATSGALTDALVWFSSDPSVATVQAGTVTAVQAGTTQVWAETQQGLRSDFCTVSVTQPQAPPTNLTLDVSDVPLKAGQRTMLTARFYPLGTAAELAWSSSNESTVVVSQDGVVTALREGKATITASTASGLSASCIVQVRGDALLPESVTISNASLTLREGQNAQLSAQAHPKNALAAEILWESRDESVAVVKNGVVSAVLPGSTAIVAHTANGRAAVCRVTVLPPDGGNSGGSQVEPWPTQGLEGFVTRLYREALGREPDAEGHASWVRVLRTGQSDARSCAYGFVFSPEMNRRNLSDRDFLETLYRVFMGRNSDPEGLADWMAVLAAGAGREEVMDGFAYSLEFERIKTSYGIR